VLEIGDKREQKHPDAVKEKYGAAARLTNRCWLDFQHFTKTAFKRGLAFSIGIAGQHSRRKTALAIQHHDTPLTSPMRELLFVMSWLLYEMLNFPE